ncbi:MAG: hypothetical protein LBP54_05425 [Campylobacteraceae bacterium]|jgi:hypothetical protein|nr:hypothetical protein [Campylobacteraceae bacterium]
MKKVVFLIFIFALSKELYAANNGTKSGFYIQTAFGFIDGKDKMIGKTQSAKELTGERKSIKEFDIGLYAQGDRGGLKGYGSLWIGDQYGVGWGFEGRYKPSKSVPLSLVLGFDEKIGLGDDVFDEKNVTIAAVNGGAPSMIYFDDNTEFKSVSLKFGVEFDISKYFAINIAYVPRWDHYKITYRQNGSSIARKAYEMDWYEFHNTVQAGFSVYF